MEIAKHCMDKELAESEFRKFVVKGVPVTMKRFVQEPAGHITLEDFLPGTTFEWTFWHDEVHIVVSGKAEVEFYQPPLFQEKGTTVMEEGDAYLIHRGEMLVFKVLSGEPYRHLCVMMPAVPLAGNEQLTRESYYAYMGRELPKK